MLGSHGAAKTAIFNVLVCLERVEERFVHRAAHAAHALGRALGDGASRLEPPLEPGSCWNVGKIMGALAPVSWQHPKPLRASC